MPHPEDTAEGEVAPDALLRNAKQRGRRKGKPEGFPSELTPHNLRG
jgi:hypothetical protein